MLLTDLDREFLPTEFKAFLEKYNPEQWISKIYRKSVLTDTLKLKNLLEKGSNKQWLKLRKDPMVHLYNMLKVYDEIHIAPEVTSAMMEINE